MAQFKIFTAITIQEALDSNQFRASTEKTGKYQVEVSLDHNEWSLKPSKGTEVIVRRNSGSQPLEG